MSWYHIVLLATGDGNPPQKGVTIWPGGGAVCVTSVPYPYCIRRNGFVAYVWPWMDRDKHLIWRWLDPERCESFGCRCNFEAVPETPSFRTLRRLCTLVKYLVVKLSTTPNLCVFSHTLKSIERFTIFLLCMKISQRQKIFADCQVCSRTYGVCCLIQHFAMTDWTSR